MTMLKITIIFSMVCSSYQAFSNASNDDYEASAEQYPQSKPAIEAYHEWTAESASLSNSGGGGSGIRHGGGGRGPGWGYNPFRWSSGPRTFYNPFSWGNPPSMPATPVVTTPPAGPDDDLDAQINAANLRAKKLELLLAKQRQQKALEELSQQGSGGSPAAPE